MYQQKKNIHFGAAIGLAAAIFSATASLAADSAVVFMYHRFGESEHPSTNITIEQFEAHIKELENGKYTVLPLPEIVDSLKNGKPLPDRTVGITIDDAYLSVYDVAWPRLKQAGLPFTLFVSTDPVGKSPSSYMSWEQIREMAGAGVTIGNHTVTHAHMPKLSGEENRREIEKAAERFEQELGKRPALFAYPYGETSQAIMELVRGAGFAAAFGQHSGGIGRNDDMYYLARFALNEKYGDASRFRLAANALALPVTDISPADPLVGEDNPPAYGFTVDAAAGNLDRLTCFSSHEGKAEALRLGESRVEVRMLAPMPKGRSRINCTMPSADDRWHWLGRQFYVLEQPALE